MREKQNHACKPEGTYPALGIMSLFLGPALAYTLVSSRRTLALQDIYSALGIAVLFVVFGLLCLFWSLSARYTWDVQGLHWRTWGRWMYVTWDQITDYYISPVQGDRPQILYVVETTSGCRRIPTHLWIGHEELKTAIAEGASKAHVGKWSVKGCRPGDPPRTFDYPLRDRLATIAGGLAIPGFLIANLIRICLKAHSTVALIGLWPAIAQYALFVLLIGAYGMLWAASMAPRFRAFRRRETITTTDAGITYRSSTETIAATWDEITAWSYVNLSKLWEVPATCKVVTDRGMFSFALAIHDRRALIAILDNKAGDAFQRRVPDWILRVDPAEYGMAPTNQGQRLYHYRTRMMRTMVVCLFVLVLVAAAAMEVNRWVSASPQIPIPLHVAIYAAVMTALGWALMRYRRCGVITDDDSITKLTPTRRHSLDWSDIRECLYEPEMGNIKLSGSRSNMSISLSIGNSRALLEEITQRATNAKFVNMDRYMRSAIIRN